MVRSVNIQNLVPACYCRMLCSYQRFLKHLYSCGVFVNDVSYLISVFWSNILITTLNARITLEWWLGVGWKMFSLVLLWVIVFTDWVWLGFIDRRRSNVTIWNRTRQSCRHWTPLDWIGWVALRMDGSSRLAIHRLPLLRYKSRPGSGGSHGSHGNGLLYHHHVWLRLQNNKIVKQSQCCTTWPYRNGDWGIYL